MKMNLDARRPSLGASKRDTIPLVTNSSSEKIGKNRKISVVRQLPPPPRTKKVVKTRSVARRLQVFFFFKGGDEEEEEPWPPLVSYRLVPALRKNEASKSGVIRSL